MIRIAAHVNTEDTIVRITEHTGFGLDRNSAEPTINFCAVEAITGDFIKHFNSGTIIDSEKLGCDNCELIDAYKVREVQYIDITSHAVRLNL